MLASSSTAERALSVLKGHRIDHFFDGMVFGPEVERGKSCPDIFLKACEKARGSACSLSGARRQRGRDTGFSCCPYPCALRTGYEGSGKTVSGAGGSGSAVSDGGDSLAGKRIFS